MARIGACLTVIAIVSMFSLVACKPFLGSILARAIAASSTPDDPQSHITDFRMPSKMDMKTGKLQHLNSNGTTPSDQPVMDSSESQSDTELPENRPTTSIMRIPASNLWQSWNRTGILSQIVDDIVKPTQERIGLVFRSIFTRTATNGATTGSGNAGLEDLEKLLANSTDDSDSDADELDSLHPDSEAALLEQSTNGTTLLSQFQARRTILRRRVAKALSSITGLLILAVNSRREAKPRTRRSLESSTDGDDPLLMADRPNFLRDVPNELDSTFGEDEPKVTELESETNSTADASSEATPRRNVETLGIFILEVFGSIAGFSWGIFKQVQSLFT